MDRKALYDLLKGIAPTYWLGGHTGVCTSPYLVIRYKNQQSAINNTFRGWQPFEVMVYVPHTSIATLDPIIKQVKDTLKSHCEPTGIITPDFLDVDLKAYTRSIEFRIIKGEL